MIRVLYIIIHRFQKFRVEISRMSQVKPVLGVVSCGWEDEVIAVQIGLGFDRKNSDQVAKKCCATVELSIEKDGSMLEGRGSRFNAFSNWKWSKKAKRLLINFLWFLLQLAPLQAQCRIALQWHYHAPLTTMQYT